MTDTFSSKKRSEIMRAVHSVDTTPELLVRRMIHSLGYRYRLHNRKLPGTPDLVFAGRKKVIFVHGCFWHRHRCKGGRSFPSSRTKYWRKKFENNQRRDSQNRRKLRKMGWDIMIIWECQIRKKNVNKLQGKITDFLNGKKALTGYS
jgi:DNA mismatch endonuclease (patch repair protein)